MEQRIPESISPMTILHASLTLGKYVEYNPTPFLTLLGESLSTFAKSMTVHPAHIPRWFLLVTALVTGAVVMALEILGSRLLAPVFGSSLFVWGALIGVILAAMSSGYAFGGWVSDRYTGGRVLAALLLFSGSWTFLIAWANQPILFEIEMMVQDEQLLLVFQ